MATALLDILNSLTPLWSSGHSYVKRLKQFFMANEVAEEDKRKKEGDIFVSDWAQCLQPTTKPYCSSKAIRKVLQGIGCCVVRTL